MKKIFLTFLLAFVMCSCVSETAKQTLNHYNEVYVKVDEIETLLQYTDLETLSVEDLVDLYDIAKNYHIVSIRWILNQNRLRLANC